MGDLDLDLNIHCPRIISKLFNDLSSPVINLHTCFPTPTARILYTKDSNNPVALGAKETRAGVSASVPNIFHVKNEKMYTYCEISII